MTRLHLAWQPTYHTKFYRETTYSHESWYIQAKNKNIHNTPINLPITKTKHEFFPETKDFNRLTWIHVTLWMKHCPTATTKNSEIMHNRVIQVSHLSSQLHLAMTSSAYSWSLVAPQGLFILGPGSLLPSWTIQFGYHLHQTHQLNNR